MYSFQNRAEGRLDLELGARIMPEMVNVRDCMHCVQATLLLAQSLEQNRPCARVELAIFLGYMSK